MDNIKKLEEIGLKKVSEETHIELKYLKYMVDSEFDKLNHINTLGFIKILSREYHLDLSGWSEAFEEYWQSNRKDEQRDGLFIVVENQKEGRKFFTFFVVLIFISIIAFGFSLIKDKLDIPQFTQQEEQQLYTPTETVEETRVTLEDLERQEALDINDTQETQKILADLNTTSEENDVIIEKAMEAEANNTKEQDIKKEDETIGEVTSALQEDANLTGQAEQNFEQTTQVTADTLIIEPKSELWIGVVFLDDFSRRSFLGEEAYTLDLTREQIITTGHGSFQIRGEEYFKDYNSQNPIRLWINDKNVTQITGNEFKELNRGNAW